MTRRDAVPISPRLLARLASLGVPLDRVRERAGRALGEPLAPALTAVTTEAFFALWQAIDEEAGRPDLGLLLGAEASERGYSVASAAALHAPDLAEALKTLARYKRLTCPELVELEVRGGEASVRFHWVLAKTDPPRLLVDSTFASFVALARRGTGGEVAPTRVELARRRVDAALRAHFGGRVVAGAPVDRLVFAEDALAVPFVTADTEAFARVVPGLEAELVGRRTRGRSLRDEVRVAIARNLSSGARPTVGRVARRLLLSPRTLQRRLGEEHTTYQEQLDDVRRTSARRLLAHTDLDPVEIAFLLGFEEPNSFARAFRAWERTTPIRWRERAARA